MKKKISVFTAILLTLSMMAGCGSTVSSASASDSGSVSADKEPLSFTSVSDDLKAPVIASVVPDEEPEYEGVTHELGDLDGDGKAEFSVDYLIDDGDIITGRIELYFDNELIYTIDDELPIDTGSISYADYDGDGTEEICFVYYPHVNSMPLDEYVVLKNVNGLWKKLDTPVDENGSNGFPVHIRYGAESCTLTISVDGYDEVIDYDAHEHYKKAVASLEAEGGSQDFINEFKRVLAGEGFSAGTDYGMVMPWGIWEVTMGSYVDATKEEQPCIKALHGIAGPLERYDILGNLYIYFNFDKKGRVKILTVEFQDDIGQTEQE